MLQSSVAEVRSCRLLRSEGGWSAVLQVPSLEPEEELVLRLLADGVLVQPGYFFDFSRESFLVVSLITPPAVLADGIDRILRHFDCSAVVP
jgi:DNA-binding transcriptional MocR family regulator